MQSTEFTSGILWHVWCNSLPPHFLVKSCLFHHKTISPHVWFFINSVLQSVNQPIYGCQSIAPVLISTWQQRKVTTRLLILIHPQFHRLSPHTVQTHPLLSAMTVLYNMRLYSLYLPFLALSLCIPAFFPRYPSHTSPPANGSYGEKKENETVSNTSA